MSDDALWAPWRMEYILAPKGGACVFCDYASTAPETFRQKLVLLVQEHAFVCLNRYPFAGSHLLVVPRRHEAALEALGPDEYEALMDLVRESVIRLKKATNAQGVNVGMNLGEAAGAGIAEHLHTHVV